ncbi:hypothetical protein HDV57DRAFT_323808 [Trichoderma longibrachiatum]
MKTDRPFSFHAFFYTLVLSSLGSSSFGMVHILSDYFWTYTLLIRLRYLLLIMKTRQYALNKEVTGLVLSQETVMTDIYIYICILIVTTFTPWLCSSSGLKHIFTSQHRNKDAYKVNLWYNKKNFGVSYQTERRLSEDMEEKRKYVMKRVRK